jgi:hypothetical protein
MEAVKCALGISSSTRAAGTEEEEVNIDLILDRIAAVGYIFIALSVALEVAGTILSATTLGMAAVLKTLLEKGIEYIILAIIGALTAGMMVWSILEIFKRIHDELPETHPFWASRMGLRLTKLIDSIIVVFTKMMTIGIWKWTDAVGLTLAVAGYSVGLAALVFKEKVDRFCLACAGFGFALAGCLLVVKKKGRADYNILNPFNKFEEVFAGVMLAFAIVNLAKTAAELKS